VPIGPLARRFAGPIVAAYLLHWGLWWLVQLTEQIVLSILTKVLNWFADLANFQRIEEASWPARWLAMQLGDSIIPILAGLLLGWWVLRSKNKSMPAAI